MAFNPTDDQLNAIDAKGTVLVSAAAGSGKTAVLAQRVIQKISDASHPVAADRLLIVTFMKAAAAEMRDRIMIIMDEKCSMNPTNTFYYKQKLLLQNSKICTIDSLCSDIVRQNFNFLGVSPDFSIADEAAIRSVSEKCMTDILNRHYADPDDDFNFLTDSLVVDANDSKIADAVIDIYNKSMCMAQPEKWLDSAVNNYNTAFNDSIYTNEILSDAESKLASAYGYIQFAMREIQGTEFSAKWFDPFFKAADSLSAMRKAASEKKWDELYQLTNRFSVANGIKLSSTLNGNPVADSIRLVKDSVKETVGDIHDSMGGNATFSENGLKNTLVIVRALVNLTKEFAESFFIKLCEKKLLTFSLIEQLTLKFLCTEVDGMLVPSEASKELCKSFDEVLVDEYQDNNNLQDALFHALSDGGKHLFMVGDVKQSIYGFRNADPDNFLRYKDSFKVYSKSETLDESKVILKANFRSRPEICNYVNAVFKAIMHKDTCGMVYNDDEMLDGQAKFPPLKGDAVKICFNDYNCDDMSRLMADAECVADYIENSLSEESFIKENSNTLRKAEYRDFTILLRSARNSAPYYVEALNKRGIPVQYNSESFSESPEVLVVTSLLKVIDNPSTDISLFAVMTSAVFGFTFDEVAQIKSEYFNRSLFASVNAAALDGNEKCVHMLSELAFLRTAAVSSTLANLLNEIYKRFSLKEIVLSLENGISGRRNLDKLAYLASDFETRYDSGLSGFLRSLENLGDTSSDNIVSTENAVRIATFHGSKGLQYKICIIADCGKDFNREDLKAPVLISKKNGIAARYITGGVVKQSSIAVNSTIHELVKKMIAEEIRLLYVAMTRAEERLMISITSKKLETDIIKAVGKIGLEADGGYHIPDDAIISASGYSDWIISSTLLQTDGAELCKYAGVNPYNSIGTASFSTEIKRINELPEGTATTGNAARTGNHQINSEMLDFIRNRLSYTYPNKDLTKVPSKMPVTDLVHGNKDTFSFSLRPQFMSKSGLTPAERGTAVHKFMQYADYSAAEHDVKSELERLYEWEFISEEEYRSIDIRVLEKFFASNVYSRIKNASEVMREYKFMVNYPFDDKNLTIIQGIADCVFFEKGEAVIVDFKTDSVKSINELAELYKKQLDIYRSAISEILKINVAECVIYSLHLGESINV